MSNVVWAYAPEWAKFHAFNDPTCWPGEPTGQWWSHRPQRWPRKCFWENPNDGVGDFRSEPSGLFLPEGASWRAVPEERPQVISPIVVCLCGSTRFSEAFQKANLTETLAGKIVLTIGCDLRSDQEIFGALAQKQLDAIKEQLDQLHLRKIDLADEVLILNVGDYIGQSTARELAYAQEHGKRIRYLEPRGEVANDTNDHSGDAHAQ